MLLDLSAYVRSIVDKSPPATPTQIARMKAIFANTRVAPVAVCNLVRAA